MAETVALLHQTLVAPVVRPSAALMKKNRSSGPTASPQLQKERPASPEPRKAKPPPRLRPVDQLIADLVQAGGVLQVKRSAGSSPGPLLGMRVGRAGDLIVGLSAGLVDRQRFAAVALIERSRRGTRHLALLRHWHTDLPIGSGSSTGPDDPEPVAIRPGSSFEP